jgi:hypothetical protein
MRGLGPQSKNKKELLPEARSDPEFLRASRLLTARRPICEALGQSHLVGRGTHGVGRLTHRLKRRSGQSFFRQRVWRSAARIRLDQIAHRGNQGSHISGKLTGGAVALAGGGLTGEEQGHQSQAKGEHQAGNATSEAGP